MYDDARLWDALKRTYLVESSESETSIDKISEKTARSGRFTLDMHIEDEGSNLSVGEVGIRYILNWLLIYVYTHIQRSLVNLARALVRDTRIVLMDEATGTQKINRGD